MAAAEDLFRLDDPSPPWWIDVLFAISACIVHIVYSTKFTGFSLAYIHALCQEKEAGVDWSESELYFRAVHAEFDLDVGSPREMKSAVNADLWRSLGPCHLVLRGLMTLCGCVAFMYSIILHLNWMYDYLVVAVIVRYGFTSFLAMLIVPFWVMIIINFHRYSLFAIMALWNINVCSDSFEYETILCSLTTSLQIDFLTITDGPCRRRHSASTTATA